MSAAITSATLFVLFWCEHSSESVEVKNEYAAALLAGKDVLPLLLDGTPLPMDLQRFQWIDFCEWAFARHGSALPSARHGPASPWKWLVSAVAAALAFGASFRFWPSGPDLESPFPSSPSAIPLLILAVLFVAGLLIALMGRSLGRQNGDVTTARTIESAIAARLAAS